MVNPARFIIGGILAKAGDLLLNPMRQALIYNTVELVHRDLQVVPGQLGERAEVMGAVALALQQRSTMTYLVDIAQSGTTARRRKNTGIVAPSSSDQVANKAVKINRSNKGNKTHIPA